MRPLLFLLIAMLIFAPFNIVTIRQLLKTHPRARRWIVAAAVIGNLMWPFLLMLRQFTPFTRWTRALLGPLWFTWTSFAILYTALTVLLVIAWLPLRRRMPLASFARWPSRVFLTLGLIGSIVGIYHALVPLRIERVPIAIAGLPPSAEGMRLALLSDLHVGLFTRPGRLTTIFETTSRLAPDAVLLAGDLIDDDPYFVPKLLAGTVAVDNAIPMLAVLGNHEMYGDPSRVIASLRGSRIQLLVNEGAALGPLWIAGVSDYAAQSANLKPDVIRAISGAGNATRILLSHQPKGFEEARRHAIPLTLSAHTHGGQCGFRPLGWSLAGVFLKYHMGLYREDAEQVYVNTGTGYWLVPFRLGMTPEITLIELRRAR